MAWFWPQKPYPLFRRTPRNLFIWFDSAAVLPKIEQSHLHVVAKWNHALLSSFTQLCCRLHLPWSRHRSPHQHRQPVHLDQFLQVLEREALRYWVWWASCSCASSSTASRKPVHKRQASQRDSIKRPNVIMLNRTLAQDVTRTLTNAIARHQAAV